MFYPLLTAFSFAFGVVSALHPEGDPIAALVFGIILPTLFIASAITDHFNIRD